MGLDFSHSDAHWAYSGFMQFRRRLAFQIGIDLNDMVGFGGHIEFHSLPADPILAFLNHSDCEGELTPEECASIGPRLIDLVKDWPEDDYDKEKATQLGWDMITCGIENTTMEFT